MNMTSTPRIAQPRNARNGLNALHHDLAGACSRLGRLVDTLPDEAAEHFMVLHGDLLDALNAVEALGGNSRRSGLVADLAA